MKQLSVFVVSAPSATGKTTLIRKLVEEHPKDVEIAISSTTRAIRPSEVNHRDYHFYNEGEFQKRIASGDMLEWANVHGNLYGSSKSEVQRILGLQKKPIMIIDVQGWHSVRAALPQAKGIFILPPSVDALWHRMEKRGSDSHIVRWNRLQSALSELESAGTFDYFIINDNLVHAHDQMQDIVINGKTAGPSKSEGKARAAQLTIDLRKASWFRELQREFGSEST